MECEVWSGECEVWSGECEALAVAAPQCPLSSGARG